MNDQILKTKSSAYRQRYQTFLQTLKKIRPFGDQNTVSFVSDLGKQKLQVSKRHPLKKLAIIEIADLLVQRENPGCFLKLTIVLPCYKMSAIHCLC